MMIICIQKCILFVSQNLLLTLIFPCPLVRFPFAFVCCTLIFSSLLFSMGNGAKAQQKRERNAAKGGATAKSQIKTNEAAKNIICSVCRQTFLLTTREPALTEHAQNKHNKSAAECFPGK
ncbi:At2g23090 like protein [Abortiporus biennis]|nr:At2g23090 like protein [Abortiporus biennis]